MNLLEQALNLVKGFSQGSNYHTDYRQPVTQIPQPTAQPQATLTPQPSPSLSPDMIKQNITKTWGANTPILNNLDLMIKAGQQLPQTEDQLLPLALALRETQGGKDLIDSTKNAHLGQNNPYNMRGVQGGNTRFVNYPDVQTATLGGQNGADQSQGLVGLLSNNPIYADFQKSGNYADFFKHWSPPADNNGKIDEQVQNIKWIINQIRQGHQ